MELIAKISKGSKMDQIYLPKNRIGLATGQYVLVSQLNNIIKKEKEFRPFFYNLKDIAPIKLQIIKQIFINLEALNPENIIITGSFLEQGFHFNDIDIILITKNKPEIREIQKNLESQLKIKIHLLVLNNKSLTEGLSKDPLYEMMLSKCVSKERLIYNAERDIDYKILDYQLLKSKSLIDNFDILNGNEKYYFLLKKY